MSDAGVAQVDRSGAPGDERAAGRDHAFAGLTRQYGPMVFSVARRITGSRHDAEDVAQACFFDLSRKSGEVRGSVAGWLHSAATFRALNMLRDRATRLRHESAALSRETLPVKAEWSDLEPLLDTAIEALPPELREVVVLHYLQDVPQTMIASRLGVDQSTVSRRLRAALRKLRAHLQAGGWAIPLAALMAMLSTRTSLAAPPTLTHALRKVSLAHDVQRTSSTPTGAPALLIAALAAILGAAVMGAAIYGSHRLHLPVQWQASRPQVDR
jgi:RNA polymerase sigma factor (sigma-70 family)